MFERILVPLDGSTLAECVLPHVVAMAETFGAKVILLQVIEERNSADGRPADPLAWQMRRMEAEVYMSGVVERLAATGVAVGMLVVEGIAPWRIVDQAGACDLLVLSTHGRSGLAPWSSGGVTRKVVEQVKCSVLLVRAFEELQESNLRRGYGRIVALLDGSKRAEAVLPVAGRLAEHWGATLLLLHVVARAPGFPADVSGATGASDDLTDALLERSIAEAQAYLQRVPARMPVHCDVQVQVHERVAGAIADAADKEGDIVLASAHGAGCDRRRRFGSMIGEVIHFGSGPLLVYQDMRPEQMDETAAERAAQEARGDTQQGAAWDKLRPQRMAWHANAA